MAWLHPLSGGRGGAGSPVTTLKLLGKETYSEKLLEKTI